MNSRVTFILGAILALGSSGMAWADDWEVTRVRGGVFVLTGGQWEQLLRGSVVDDDRVIKSAPGSRATLVRGSEAIEIGPDTTIQVEDAGGYTTVYNHAGMVGVDAEARNVQHFAVQTPFLAAIVKGTAFVVRSDSRQSTVAVTRGNVEVDDEVHGTSVNLVAGQEVSSGVAPITTAQVVPLSQSLPPPPAPVARPVADAAANSQASSAGSAADNGAGRGNGNGNGSENSGAGGGNRKGNSGSNGSEPGGGNENGNSSNGNGNGGSGRGNSGSGDSGAANGNGNGSGNSGNGAANGNGDTSGNGNGTRP